MKVYSKIEEIQDVILDLKSKGKSIGFVPTMGALHEGHLSLVEKSTQNCDFTIVSVFVNPTQFNNQLDLENYPRTIEQDLELLKSTSCDFVFAPSINEIYPESFEKVNLNLGTLEHVMEGKHRPGHFDGVVNVVKRLFEITLPTKAYFGLKDFQQVAVIKFMTNAFEMHVEIVACETLREPSGLAMSSRNQRLSLTDREDATIIFKTLQFAKANVHQYSPIELIEQSMNFFNLGNLKLEYFEIVNPLTLESLENEWVKGATACIVAYCGNVRLIDNLEL